MKPHQRFFTAPFEVRDAEGNPEAKTIKGYAALYNVPTFIWERNQQLEEVIMPGAFDTANMEDIRCLLNHNADFIFGRTASNTLTVGTDATGLWYECALDMGIQSHADLYKQIQRGDINQSSFAFTWPAKGVTMTTTAEGEPNRREIKLIDHVYDVSPVTYPAYQETSVEARSAQFRTEVGENNIILSKAEVKGLNNILAAFETAATEATKLIGIATDSRLQRQAIWWIENLQWKKDEIEWLIANAQPEQRTADPDKEARESRIRQLRLKALS